MFVSTYLCMPLHSLSFCSDADGADKASVAVRPETVSAGLRRRKTFSGDGPKDAQHAQQVSRLSMQPC